MRPAGLTKGRVPLSLRKVLGGVTGGEDTYLVLQGSWLGRGSWQAGSGPPSAPET